MAKKQKITPNQREFKKQQTRLRNAQRRLEKQGYYFAENMIPPLPHRVTKKSLEEIRSITTAELKRQALWVDRSTGEVIGTGTELAQKQRRATRSKLRAAGKRTENVQRLKEYAAKRKKITTDAPYGSYENPMSYEDYQAEVNENYVARMEAMTHEYSDEVEAQWDRLWAQLHRDYNISEIADALAAAGGVPEPYGAYEYMQWNLFWDFAGKLQSELGHNNEVAKIVQDIQQAIEDDEPWEDYDNGDGL